jgi:glutamine amidotransferase-like uncharacterized protein
MEKIAQPPTLARPSEVLVFPGKGVISYFLLHVTLALNLAASKMDLSWVPSEILSMPSWAELEKMDSMVL